MNFFKIATYKDINYSPEALIPILESNKVVLLKDYNNEKPALEFFESFSDGLGNIFNMDEDLQTGKPTGKRWIDITYDPAVMDRYRSAPVAQPLHTDSSYREVIDNINFFYCVSQAEKGGATTFIDSKEVVNLIELAEEDQLLKDLMSIDVIFSKDARKKIAPILKKDGDDYRFNWNYFKIDANNTEEAKDLAERFHTFLERRVVQSGLLTHARLEKNDVVFFNDEMVLHGRCSYFGKYKGQRSLNKGCIILESRMDKNVGLFEHEKQA